MKKCLWQKSKDDKCIFPNLCLGFSAHYLVACSIHAKHPQQCPDELFVYSKNHKCFGISIKDYGDSFIEIYFCPFCGTFLKR